LQIYAIERGDGFTEEKDFLSEFYRGIGTPGSLKTLEAVPKLQLLEATLNLRREFPHGFPGIAAET
jgi:hypothetical protein